MLKELYSYRQMIFSLVKRDVSGRYKGSVLGFLWTFLNPLFQLLIYTLVFSVIIRSPIEDYYLHLFVALIPWIFFSTSLSGGTRTITGAKQMVQKIYFPREVLPIAFVTGQLVNMLLSFIVIFAVLIISGKGISPVAVLFLPIVILAEYMLALGVALIVSAITVYLRDMEYVMQIITLFWQFATPVMYSMQQVPDNLKSFYYLNPMTSIINSYRDILYYKKAPDIMTLFQGIIFGVLFLFLGFYVFGKLKRHFAEEL